MESVKAPFEFISASFRRSQKQLSSEMKIIVQQAENLENKSEDELSEVYRDIVRRIDVLLNVLDDADAAEKDQLKKMIARCQEYQRTDNSSPREILSGRWELALIGDFLLRRGHMDAVDALIEESGEWLNDLLDVQIYKTALAVEAAVLRGELDLALQWVQDHASKLRRLNSALEFFVRQEQFLTLVYTGKSLEALRFAQTYLAPLVADKPPTASTSDAVAKTPSSSDRKRDKRSSSITSEGSEDGTLLSTTDSVPPRPDRSASRPPPQRQRAVSLGTAPPSSPVTTRRFSPYRSRTSTSVLGGGGGTTSSQLYATPPRHPPVSSNNTSDTSLPISLPFSFSANPLAFFRYSRGPSQPSARERSSSGNFTDLLSGDANFGPLGGSSGGALSGGDSSAETVQQEQNTYMKEAMCHLMSMLAFMSPTDERHQQGGDEKGGDSSPVQVSKKSRNSSTVASSSPALSSATSSVGESRSMVPCLYERLYTSHRRRCIVDLFRVEFRRVYCQRHVSVLEQLVKLGVFVMKTPACRTAHSPSSQSQRSLGKDASTGSSGNGSGSGGALMSSALRYVREGIRSARTRARSGSSGSATSSHSGNGNGSGAEEMEVEDVQEATRGRRGGSSVLHRDVQQQSSSPPSRWPECPVCTPDGQLVASSLPAGVYTARAESVLVCRGSGKVMNHDNPPVALPNGQVYSRAFVMSRSKPRGPKAESGHRGSSRSSSKKSSPGHSSPGEGTRPGSTATHVSSARSSPLPPAITSPSLFGGCYCSGSSLHTDGSSPRSSGSHSNLGLQVDETVSQSNDSCPSDVPKEQDEQLKHSDKVGTNGIVTITGTTASGREARSMSAIEIMMRLRSGNNTEGHSFSASNGVGERGTDHSDGASDSKQGNLADLLHDLESSKKPHDDEQNQGADEHVETEDDGRMSISPPTLYFTCPTTGSTVDVSELRSVFIV